MAATIYSAAVTGLEAERITIETRIAPGLGYLIIGLPDDAVRESLFRIESAIDASGFHMPRQRILINMAPASLRKSGAAFDLAIAISILCASGQLEVETIKNYLFAGELSLNGGLRPVRGVLAMALEAKRRGLKGLVVPSDNAAEAAMVQGLDIYAFDQIKEAIGFLSGEPARPFIRSAGPVSSAAEPLVDFAAVKGQPEARRALEIAAAGGHHVLLNGPPGAGKSMLARRLPTILPLPTWSEQLAIARVYSVAGKLEMNELMARPFRSPHHTCSDIALVGGGISPLPGEISLADQGVLFLDELPEFRRRVLEVLRQPLEERRIAVSRANYNVTFPADFLLIAAMNPCPCGYQGHPYRPCRCTLQAIRNYRGKISGPILDRIDLQVNVAPVTLREMESDDPAESSAAIRSRVVAARAFQTARQGSILNAHLSSDQVRRSCVLDPVAKNILFDALEKHHYSARSYDRILKVARTIADLAGSEPVLLSHLSEALAFRHSSLF